MAPQFNRYWPTISGTFLHVLALAVVFLVAAVVLGCSNSDGDREAGSAAGTTGGAVASSSDATAQPTTAAAATGDATPLPTQGGPATSTPRTAPAASTSAATAPAEVSLFDLVPCSARAYYDDVVTEEGIPILVYEDVPAGTPILFPFEHGRVLTVDNSANTIAIVYDVEGVGVLTIQAAGTTTLDRSVDNPRRGTVIGHFTSNTFDQFRGEDLEGSQLYAVVGSKELVTVGTTAFYGQPLDPRVSGCSQP